MSIIFGLHVLVALFFAVHAVRTGQPLFWLLILFMFPMFGSIAYFVAIYLPNSRLQHGARKAVVAASRALDPSRELREARAAFEETPTAQNQMRLAAALLEAGTPEEAARPNQRPIDVPEHQPHAIASPAIPRRIHPACQWSVPDWQVRSCTNSQHLVRNQAPLSGMLGRRLFPGASRTAFLGLR